MSSWDFCYQFLQWCSKAWRHSILDHVCWSPSGGAWSRLISVDIIFDKDDGDLTCKRAQEKWLSFIRRATVAGTYFGPPCNTWSVSRWRAVTHGDKGPRPVRTVAEPFGEQSLRLKEIRDVTLGNQLLFFALEVTLLQALLFRVAVLEHPAPPDPARIPSIWFLNATHAIKQLANYTEVLIFQGLFGAVSPKPTCLGITSCTDPAKRLASFETTSVMPPPLKMGRGGQGREEFHNSPTEGVPWGTLEGTCSAEHWLVDSVLLWRTGSYRWCGGRPFLWFWLCAPFLRCFVQKSMLEVLTPADEEVPDLN